MPQPRPRVVITGLGVVAPNAHGLEAYEKALRDGVSGIRFVKEMADSGFGCHVAGVPEISGEILREYFSEEELFGMNSGMLFACVASRDAWRDAGLALPEKGSQEVHWGSGAVIGTGIGGMDTIAERLVPGVRERNVRRLGSAIIERVMASGASAKVGGMLGLGNQVTSNSSACSTGTEAVIHAALRIRHGLADRMLAGGAEGASVFTWAGFDSMRVLDRNHNDAPEKASRPMSRTAGGFVPAAGAGILLLENMECALARGARIYAEILGFGLNCGGQRQGGTMTAPNPTGVRRCIRTALDDAGLRGDEIDALSGHLTATFADGDEIRNWQAALGVTPERFPPVNAPKSLFGHALGAAGGLECVACVLELHKGFFHGSANCEDLREDLLPFEKSIPRKTLPMRDLSRMAKANFGFGDVNSCVVFQKWKP